MTHNIPTEGFSTVFHPLFFDPSPCQGLARLRRRYGFLLVVDDAHATLVCGEHGGGTAEMQGASAAVDVHVGTLSKAFGCLGGFAACSSRLRALLLNRGRHVIFSTSLPVPVVAAARAALRVAQRWAGGGRSLPPCIWTHRKRRFGVCKTVFLCCIQKFAHSMFDLATAPCKPHTPIHNTLVPCPTRESWRRRHVWDLVTRLSSRVGVPAHSPVIPLVIGLEAPTMEAARQLLAQGFHVGAIRPPTVPEGTCRLRVSLSAAHSFADVDALADALLRCRAGAAAWAFVRLPHLLLPAPWTREWRRQQGRLDGVGLGDDDEEAGGAAAGFAAVSSGPWQPARSRL
jgi:8-amino-7-oxononanoate synthase